MQPGKGSDVTKLLKDWQNGDTAALSAITDLLYAELRKLAAGYMRREANNQTFQPTVLVHEAYLKLAALGDISWESRSHFLGIAAHLMRQILIQHVRTKHADKRGGGQRPVELKEELVVGGEDSRELIALDDGLVALEKVDPRASRMLEMRYFGGLTTEEIAQAESVSTATVERTLRFAHAWLRRELSSPPQA